MMRLERFSERYQATGGLAAIGVLNQLGRPDIEPLEVLVREAVQNCWDARHPDSRGIRVEIGRRTLAADEVSQVRQTLLVDPPPGLPLDAALVPGMTTLYFADFGTRGLGGPTRADEESAERDFVDFVRNIGQPPDNELGGGSFGYGKAAFYIASRARTVVVDTLCEVAPGRLERRLLGCALGDNFAEGGVPHTGRHWWGRIVDGVPEPVTGDDAHGAAALLGLPPREDRDHLGTTVLVVAPDIAPDQEDETDTTMEFIAEALAWNFWPRMVSTPGGASRTMQFVLTDEGRRVRVPDPRAHERLRDFVSALDRLREEPGDEDDFTIDRSISCLRPVQHLGRLVIQKGPVAPVDLPARPVPQGARITATSVHHVALIRQAELVVKYLPGPQSVHGRAGYSGVFQSAVDVDEAFRRSEPPTHDDWNHRFIPTDEGYDKRFVKVALERMQRVCREAAGYDAVTRGVEDAEGIPLGQFADALATLMPGVEGPGARRAATVRSGSTRRRRRRPGATVASEASAGVWVDAEAEVRGDVAPASGENGPDTAGSEQPRPKPRRPQTRVSGDPTPGLAPDGEAVIRYPFELRVNGNRVRLTASVEVMTNDGAQVEAEPPVGYRSPEVVRWIDPAGRSHDETSVTVGPDTDDGQWTVEVPLDPNAMFRVDIRPEPL